MSYCVESHVLLCRSSIYIDLLYYCWVMNKSIVLCVTTSLSYLSLELQILVLENNSLQSDSNRLHSDFVLGYDKLYFGASGIFDCSLC